MHVERALELGERLRLSDVVAEALINKALIVQRRPNESLALMRQALILSEAEGIPRSAIRACMNLCYLHALAGRSADARAVAQHGLELARRLGDRYWERSLVANLMGQDYAEGEWDALVRTFDELDDAEQVGEPVHALIPMVRALVALHRGEPELALSLVEPFVSWRESARVQTIGAGVWARCVTALAEERVEDVAPECLRALADDRLRQTDATGDLFELGLHAAWLLRSAEHVTALAALWAQEDLGAGPAYLAALDARIRACEAALTGHPDPPFTEARRLNLALGDVVVATRVGIEQVEWLAEQGRNDEAAALLPELSEIATRLGEVHWQARLAQVSGRVGVAVAPEG